MHSSSPSKPTKFKQTFSNRKCMTTGYWERKGVLLVEFIERGTTAVMVVPRSMNIAYGVTHQNLRRPSQNKRRGMLSLGIVLLHYNALPHTANATKNLAFGMGSIRSPSIQPGLSSFRFPSLSSYEKEFRWTPFCYRQWAAEQRTNLAESTGGYLLWRGDWKVDTALQKMPKSERRLCREVDGRCT